MKRITSCTSLLILAVILSSTNSFGKTASFSKKKDIKTKTFYNQKKTNEENFSSFLKRFNSDANFQLSRVVFPLKLKLLNDDYKTVNKNISRKDFRRIILLNSNGQTNEDMNNYVQQIKVTGLKALITIRGVENGINADYYFEITQGKWKLVGIKDVST